MCWSRHWRAFLDLHTPGGVGQAGMIYYPCLSGGQGPDPTQLYDSWFVVLSAASWTAWCWNLSLEVLVFSSTDSPPCLGSTFPARVHGVNSLARNKVSQTGWLRATGMRALEVGGPKSKCQKGWLLVKVWTKICSRPFSLASRRLSSHCVSSPHFPLVYACLSWGQSCPFL